MGRVGGSAILGKSRNGNRISRRVAEALRGGIRVLCGIHFPLGVVLRAGEVSSVRDRARSFSRG